MAILQISAFMALLAAAAADVNEIVGNNQYLPPSKGYNYDRPPQPFPSSPAPRPTPSYRPPAPSSPAYQPPTPSYQPPAPTPSYRPPSPSYGPPVSRPPAPRPSPSGPNYSGAPSSGSGVSIAVGGGGDHDHSHDHHEPGMPYDFEYKVKDDTYGTDYSRNEVSDGDVIRGEYRVQLPDGRLQIVKYTADWKNGFNADVSYQGEPQYPAASSNNNNVAPYPAAGRPSNSYGPPSPSASAPANSYGPPSAGY